MEFLEVFNAVAESCKAIPREYVPAKSYDDPINEDTLNLDSLDITLTFATLSDVYQIPEELENSWPTESVGALRDFIEANKAVDPTDEYPTGKAVARAFK
jgi:acyl carrier protein